MQRLINLVGTRCVDGDHAALRRWYADHVHMLMGFPDLLGATLYAVQGGAPAPAPQYLCLYEFASAEAFEAYETSTLRAEVEQDRQRGWGRDGIEIVMRTPYLALYRRAPGGGFAAARSWHLQALRCSGAPSPAAERALAARFGFETGLVLLRGHRWPSSVAEYLVLSAPAAAASALPATLTEAWCLQADVLARWDR